MEKNIIFVRFENIFLYLLCFFSMLSITFILYGIFGTRFAHTKHQKQQECDKNKIRNGGKK